MKNLTWSIIIIWSLLLLLLLLLLMYFSPHTHANRGNSKWSMYRVNSEKATHTNLAYRARRRTQLYTYTYIHVYTRETGIFYWTYPRPVIESQIDSNFCPFEPPCCGIFFNFFGFTRFELTNRRVSYKLIEKKVMNFHFFLCDVCECSRIVVCVSFDRFLKWQNFDGFHEGLRKKWVSRDTKRV